MFGICDKRERDASNPEREGGGRRQGAGISDNKELHSWRAE